ncbi:MAG: homoserine dehydrogenase [Actinomycetaceae bacterium]|nr:homoserine dehydrogenase [Actinomycetaceae bacterium]
MSADNTVKVGVLGCGTVGTQVVRLLRQIHSDLQARSGANLEISGIAVRDLDAPRDVSVPRNLLTTDMDAVIDGADLVIELMGGIEPARTAMLRALKRGASVVTGNKAVLATHGPELYEAAAENNTDLYYEAAVAGAVPVVYGLRESLVGDRITKVLGILNGTTNYILDQMDSQGWSYEQALKEAQALGFAEADPTADVDGLDAAAKCAILASLAFHTRVNLDEVAVEGIREITAVDMAEAKRSGKVIKLVAVAERIPGPNGDAVSVRVAPTLVSLSHPLATVGGAFNAIVIESENAGRLMFSGPGAGGAPTASAVLSDVVAAAGHIAHGGNAPRENAYAMLPILPQSQVKDALQVRMQVTDEPGTLAHIAKIYEKYGVSIAAVSQRLASSTQGTEQATLVLTTHAAPMHAHEAVLSDLSSATHAVTLVENAMRVEGE